MYKLIEVMKITKPIEMAGTKKPKSSTKSLILSICTNDVSPNIS